MKAQVATTGKRGRVRAFLTDLFFPPRCAACGELLPLRQDASPTPVLCPDCLPRWVQARTATSGYAYAQVWLVSYRPGRLDGVPERVIYRIKHQDDRRLIDWVTAELAQSVQDALEREKVTQSDLLCLYPPRRRAAVRKDGFDQARLLAYGLARRLGCEVLPAIRRRSDGAGAQKELDAVGRQASANTSYELDRKLAPRLSGRFVILVDDLSTTGATLGRLASLAREAGTTGVLFATVAKTDSKGSEGSVGGGAS